MSQIILKASMGFPSEIIGYRCDFCGEEIIKTNVEDYGWVRFRHEDYCEDCKLDNFIVCKNCRTCVPYKDTQAGLCQDCR
jgi:hypothetical protein